MTSVEFRLSSNCFCASSRTRRGGVTQIWVEAYLKLLGAVRKRITASLFTNDAHLATYAVRLILATHPNESAAPPAIRQYVRHGASPRGLQALVAGAQVRALLEDRFNVAREDLQAVALPALRHRLILGFEAQADGITPDRLVGDVLSSVQVPRP